MADFSLIDGQRFETDGAVEASSTGTQITAAGSANVKGLWTQLVAATGFDARMIIVTISNPASSAQQLVDIGIGGSGSETVKIPNLHQGVRNIRIPYVYAIPIFIPGGSRISARCQSSTGSQIIRVQVMLVGMGFSAGSPLGRVTDYGTAVGSSSGTQVDPGGTANTKGAWTQIIASTSNRMRGLLIAIGNNNNSVTASLTWLFDIAIGAGGSEHVKLLDLQLGSTSTGAALPLVYQFIPLDIPAGTRLSARCQCSDITATIRILTMALYGVD